MVNYKQKRSKNQAKNDNFDAAVLDKYKQKKLKNADLLDLIEKYASESQYFRIMTCASFLHFVGNEVRDRRKLYRLNGCGNRYCPMCAWRKARGDAFMLSTMLEYIQQEKKKSFIFLTLTAPNVKAEDLEEEIDHYNKSFKRLMQRKCVKSVVHGYVRKLEITYNKNRDDYHPHFHVILAVNKSYFTDSKSYLNRNEWLKLWQQATRNKLITQVDVRKLQSNKGGGDVREVTKYAAKDSEYLLGQEIFDTFYNALHRKRIVVYSGLMKDAKTKYENGDLDHYKEKDDDEFIYEIFTNWGNGSKYEDSGIHPIRDEIYHKVN